MSDRAPTYYQMLGVKPEVSSTEIKQAYRRLAKSHHPDAKFSAQTEDEQVRANQFMMKLNEAYETLIDISKRADYDVRIGANGKGPSYATNLHFEESDARELYLRKHFHPARQSMVRVMNKYKAQLSELAQDIYDDRLVAAFEKYVDEVERVLLASSTNLSSREVPGSLRAAVQMMRYSIAQAADALDEMRHFCENYDYNHLHMAQNLFREANELSRKGLSLSKA